MLIKLTDDAALLVLGALRRVATAGGSRSITAADRRALDGFDCFVLRRDPASDLEDLPEASPTQLAATLQSDDVRNPWGSVSHRDGGRGSTGQKLGSP
jgi:hypothetical protein